MSTNQINSQITQQQKVSADAKQAAENLSKQLPPGGSVYASPGGSGNALPPTARPTGAKTGAYREAFKRGFIAFEQRQWTEARKGFEEALADYGVDSGEAINILGIRSSQPYLPKYFLGVTLRNLGDCAGARRLWAESEKDGAIQKTTQIKSLEQERAKCK